MPQNINRLLTRPLTRLLLKTPLSANQITLLSLGVGLTAGPFLGQPQYPLNILGALLFQLYYLLDNCDGEIARARHQQSRLGGWLDLLTDTIVHTWIYGWLALWVRNNSPRLAGVVFLAPLGIFLCYFLSLLAHWRGFTIALKPCALKQSKEPLRLRQWMQLNLDNENFSLFFLLVTLLRLTTPFFLATAIGANLFWARTLLRRKKEFFATGST